MKRLKKSFEYQQLRKLSKVQYGVSVAIDSARFENSRFRYGITVSKKYGKAHQRNRFKRLVREAVRSCSFEAGFWINIRPIKEIISLDEVKKDLNVWIAQSRTKTGG